MNTREILTDIHALEEELLEFERKYGLRSEIFYAAYRSGEEPEDDAWVPDFGEWASIYETRFQTRAALGAREEGLKLLDELDRTGR